MNKSLMTFKKAREALIKAGVPTARVRDLLIDGQLSFLVEGGRRYEEISKKLKKLGLQVSATFGEDETRESDRYYMWVRL
jgi:hypothetical protein